jgi:putative phosphoesterase
VDPRIHDALDGVVEIVHAGDVCSDAILYELETIAPVTVALGNCDGEGVAGFGVPFVARTMVAGVRILVIHDISDLGDMPTEVDVVVCGHSHVPGIQYHGRVLVVNPGSATQPRLVPAPTVAILEIDDEARVSARIVRLDELGGS